MKALICGLVLLVSSAAFAENQKFVCVQYDRGTEQLINKTVVLQQTGAGEFKEGIPMAFFLEIYEGQYPVAAYKGVAETEDVMFNFTSNDGKASFSMYLDEMNESSLTIDGNDHGDFMCY